MVVDLGDGSKMIVIEKRRSIDKMREEEEVSKDSLRSHSGVTFEKKRRLSLSIDSLFLTRYIVSYGIVPRELAHRASFSMDPSRTLVEVSGSQWLTTTAAPTTREKMQQQTATPRSPPREKE